MTIRSTNAALMGFNRSRGAGRRKPLYVKNISHKSLRVLEHGCCMHPHFFTLPYAAKCKHAHQIQLLPRSGLVLQAAIPFPNQQLHAFWESMTQGFDVQAGVDIGTALPQPGPKIIHRLFPRTFWQRLVQSVAEPRHGRFVKHHFLQMAWLRTGIVPPERFEVAIFQSPLEFRSDLPCADVVKSFATIDEDDRRLFGAEARHPGWNFVSGRGVPGELECN